MPIGLNNGTPSDGFSFRRSFIGGVSFPHRLGANIGTPPNFVFIETLAPANTYYINLLPEFWVWSSNMYTLDHIVVDAYATISPSPAIIPLNCRVTFQHGSPTDGNRLLIDVVIIEGVYDPVVIPAQDQPYWYPP